MRKVDIDVLESNFIENKMFVDNREYIYKLIVRKGWIDMFGIIMQTILDIVYLKG